MKKTRLPRLLEDDRVEVRIESFCTHVFKEPEIDVLIAHLQEAKALLSAQPAEIEPSGISGQFNYIANATEMVEQPAEVCEWVNVNYGMQQPGCGGEESYRYERAKFCPYCGKPIKVKGE
ncbi:MAG: hypothetical protein A2Y38_25270 [Spirochaetes bacterium GWB1_59_5]|nr:MAG: hypothetical protein A2Y38_25270 [Spirochaetes bacterium GWB1_59_5]